MHGVVGIWGIMAVLFNNGDATLMGQIVGIVGKRPQRVGIPEHAAADLSLLTKSLCTIDIA